MFTINGETWHIVIVSPWHPALQKDNGDYALGMCYDGNKTIYISAAIEEDSSLFWKVLCHEITHAAMFSYNVDLNIDQEELIAELISTYGFEIIEITNKIFYHIQERGNYY